ncbi:hypothetical protein ACHAXT_011982 [Thalassiosira profunda]
MSAPAAAAMAATAADPSHQVGLDIGRIMTSKGPIVKCVLLRAHPAKGSNNDDGAPALDPDKDAASMSVKEIKLELTSYGIDGSQFVEKPELVKALQEARANVQGKPSAEEGEEEKTDANGAPPTKVVPLQHLIEEVDVDTTPRKSMVAKILGGDFTFLGQYEDEGVMVMVRRPDWVYQPEEFEGDIPPVNSHPLQPPLHDVEVRGDILLLRVAETEEELDYEKEVMDAKDAQEGVLAEEGEEKKEDAKQAAKEGEGKSEKAQDVSPEIHVPANDEFFLDYTREEYLKFAARTDIEIEEEESESSEGEEEESIGEEDDEQPAAGEDDDKDDDFDPEEEMGSDDEDSEEHQVGMMNMILSHMLRRFREENGRGPDSLELLEMRKALADRLGVEVPPVDEEADDWEKKSPSASGTPRKVVVAEALNETEEIPGNVEGEGAELKRAAGEMEGADGEEERSKKAKVDGEAVVEES